MCSLKLPTLVGCDRRELLVRASSDGINLSVSTELFLCHSPLRGCALCDAPWPKDLLIPPLDDEDFVGIKSDQLNRMSSDEEEEEAKLAEISEARDVEIEVFLDGLNLDPLTDLN